MCTIIYYKVFKWKVKSFLTDAANQISDNDWTLGGKTFLVVSQWEASPRQTDQSDSENLIYIQ